MRCYTRVDIRGHSKLTQRQENARMDDARPIEAMLDQIKLR